MASREAILQKFNKTITKHRQIHCHTRVLQQLLMFMEHSIRQQLKTFTLMLICNSHRTKFLVTQQLQRAFFTLNLEEKTQMYELIATSVYNIEHMPKVNESKISISLQQSRQAQLNRSVRFQVEVPVGFRSWQTQHMHIQGYKMSSKNNMTLDLRNYLLRRSKKTQRQCFALQSCSQSLPQTLRFSFKTKQDQTQYLRIIQTKICHGLEEMVQKMVNNEAFNSNLKKNQLSRSQTFKLKRKKIQESLKEKEQQAETITPEALHLPLSSMKKIGIKLQDLKIDQQSSQMSEQKNQSLKGIQSKKKLTHLDRIQSNLHFNSPKSQKSIEFPKASPARTSNFPSVLVLPPQLTSSILDKAQPHPNIFKNLLPFYNLTETVSLPHMQQIQKSSSLIIYQSVLNPHLFSFILQTQLSQQVATKGLASIALYSKWHPSVNQSAIIHQIPVENSALGYFKIYSCSKHYKQRDFVLLRHVFSHNNAHYICDKSIEHQQCPATTQIQRGSINYQLFKVQKHLKGTLITGECLFNHKGSLNLARHTEITLNYIKGFKAFQNYFSKYSEKLQPLFDLDWQTPQQQEIFSSINSLKITKVVQNTPNLTTNTTLPLQININKAKETANSTNNTHFQHNNSFMIGQPLEGIDQSQVFFSIVDENQQNQLQEQTSIHQVQTIIKKQQIIHRKLRKLDIFNFQLSSQGRIIVLSKYLKSHHQIVPTSKSSEIFKKYDKIRLFQKWQVAQQGGLILISDKKKQKSIQNASNAKQNYFTNLAQIQKKSPVLNRQQTNLQRLCKSLCMAPRLIEEAANTSDHIVRMKLTIVFGLSVFILYQHTDEPVRPLLGQTYQGFIDGCPISAQQISQNPCVSSVFMKGRGYTIHASVQSSIVQSLNSIQSVNKGWHHILFDDGQQICFQTAPALVSGVSSGIRTFNFREKAYFYDRTYNLYAQMKFQDSSGISGSSKWQYKDQIQAQILEVKPQFLNKFIARFDNKRKILEEKHIRVRYDKLQGRWPFHIQCQQKQIVYSVRQHLPYQLEEDAFALPSNSSFREDVYYSKIGELQRSKQERMRIEAMANRDRQLRTKYAYNKN